MTTFRRLSLYLTLGLWGPLLAGCVASSPEAFPRMMPAAAVSQPRPLPGPITQCGQASWYAMTSRTASGERANPNAMTAAHRSLPFGTRVRVTNLDNGRSTVVRVNDRGPFLSGRVIDVSKAAAAKLGFVSDGVARVRIQAHGAGNRLPRTECS